MSRKTLAEALKAESAAQPEPVPEAQQEDVAGRRYEPPSRRGKKALTVHFDPGVVRQLKMLGIEQDRSTQAMVAEALNDFFEKHGKPPVA